MLIAKVFVCIVGLLVGAFLNVCICRISQNQLVKLWSRCSNCERSIPVWKNVSVFSYIFLSAKCSVCGIRISWFCPVVEILTSLSFYLLFVKYGFVPPLAINAIFFSFLIILIFVDLSDRVLPNGVTFLGIIVGWLFSPLQSSIFLNEVSVNLSFFNWTHYIWSSLGILIGGGFLWVVSTLHLKLKKGEGLGFGDIKMMSMVGAFLGWQYAFLTIFLASLLGVFIGVFFIAAYHKGKAYELPFGSFLGVGAMITTLIGPKLFS